MLNPIGCYTETDNQLSQFNITTNITSLEKRFSPSFSATVKTRRATAARNYIPGPHLFFLNDISELVKQDKNVCLWYRGGQFIPAAVQTCISKGQQREHGHLAAVGCLSAGCLGHTHESFTGRFRKGRKSLKISFFFLSCRVLLPLLSETPQNEFV